MTREEAHRRAIEAGARALAERHYETARAADINAWRFTSLQEYVDICWIQYVGKAESAITAYLAAMVLPIEEAPIGPWLLVWHKRGHWTQAWRVNDGGFTDGIGNWITNRLKFFTFLPEPPK